MDWFLYDKDLRHERVWFSKLTATKTPSDLNSKKYSYVLHNNWCQRDLKSYLVLSFKIKFCGLFIYPIVSWELLFLMCFLCDYQKQPLEDVLQRSCSG